MDLYILRHGIAEDVSAAPGRTDSARRLTAEGAKKVRRVAEGLKAAELHVDLIVTSPYMRARQTAEIVAKVLRLRQLPEISAWLTPDQEPEAVLKVLKGKYANQQSLMLVGHEPCLGRLISFLLVGNTGMVISLKKGGICNLTVGRLKLGPCAELEWLLTPGQARGLQSF